jgi:WD40 repeat protein
MIELTGHTGLVVALAYSPDGRMLASASDDGTARLWDVRGRRLVERLQSPAARAECVAFSADGKSLAVGYSTPGLVQWWELDPLRRRESWLAHDVITHSLAFHPGGQFLTTGGVGGTVKTWQLPGLEFREDRIDTRVWAVKAVAYSPDGSALAALSARPVFLSLWPLKAPRKAVRLSLAAEWGRALCFSPDGHRLFAGLEGQVAVWECASDRKPQKWPAHDGAVSGVAFTRDGDTLLTGGFDGLVKLWDREGRLKHSFDWRISDVGAVAFAPDGLTAAAGGLEKILIWDVEGV